MPLAICIVSAVLIEVITAGVGGAAFFCEKAGKLD